jgi:hypothetical protein
MPTPDKRLSLITIGADPLKLYVIHAVASWGMKNGTKVRFNLPVSSTRKELIDAGVSGRSITAPSSGLRRRVAKKIVATDVIRKVIHVVILIMANILI